MSLQRQYVQNREVTYSFFLVFTQVIVYYTLLHLAFFHVARYLKGPSVLFFVMTSLIATINNGIYFLVRKSKGSYFTHHLTKLDFSDSQPNSKLGRKGPAPYGRQEDDRKEIISHRSYHRKKQKSPKK